MLQIVTMKWVIIKMRLNTGKKTVEYNPNNIDAKVNLANTYAILGDKDTAIRKIRSAYLLDKKKSKDYSCICNFIA